MAKVKKDKINKPMIGCLTLVFLTFGGCATVAGISATNENRAAESKTVPTTAEEVELLERSTEEIELLPGAPTLTLPEAIRIQEKLGQIHSDFTDPKYIHDARATCWMILKGNRESDIDVMTAVRFSAGRLVDVDEKDADAIVYEVIANGFCEVE